MIDFFASSMRFFNTHFYLLVLLGGVIFSMPAKKRTSPDAACYNIIPVRAIQDSDGFFSLFCACFTAFEAGLDGSDRSEMHRLVL